MAGVKDLEWSSRQTKEPVMSPRSRKTDAILRVERVPPLRKEMDGSIVPKVRRWSQKSEFGAKSYNSQGSVSREGDKGRTQKPFHLKLIE